MTGKSVVSVLSKLTSLVLRKETKRMLNSYSYAKVQQSAPSLAPLASVQKSSYSCLARTRIFLATISFLFLVSFSYGAGSDSASTLFENANRLYEQGKFGEAAAAYEKLTQAGRVPVAVYYNLGNAFFKAGQIGRAIAAYHRAQESTPRDPDLKANLQFARNQVQGMTFTSPLWKRWLGKLSLDEWTVLADAALWSWLLLLSILQWRPSLKPALRTYAAIQGVVALLACAGFLAALGAHRSDAGGVVISRDAVVRQGPFEESPATFTLHDGAELKVLDRKEDWFQISTGPRRIGWMKSDQVVLASNS